MLGSILFASSKEGCEKLPALFQRLNISQENLLIGMEATGYYWLSVYGYLLEQGFGVKVINPIQPETFRKMYIRQRKNDQKDSFIIAQIMRFSQVSATGLVEETIVALRQLSRCRLSLVDACGDCKRRIIALLDQVFPSTTCCSQISSASPPRKSFPSIPRRKIRCPFPPESSPIILGEIGDIQCIDAPNKLVAFAGLTVRGVYRDPTENLQTGLAVLRRALWPAASRAAFCAPFSRYTTSPSASGASTISPPSALSPASSAIRFIPSSRKTVPGSPFRRKENNGYFVDLSRTSSFFHRSLYHGIIFWKKVVLYDKDRSCDPFDPWCR